jgi:uncharacterized protein YegJ (DUF2314 family)
VKALLALILVTSAVFITLGCSGKNDEIIEVLRDDAEMNAAIEKARSTLDQFWARRDAQGGNFQGLLKVYFTDPGSEDEGEHTWVEATGHTGEAISGVLLSTPAWLKSVSEGDAVSFPYDRVTDWLYIEDGKAQGAYTVQLLRSRMSEKDRRLHDAGYPFEF